MNGKKTHSISIESSDYRQHQHSFSFTNGCETCHTIYIRGYLQSFYTDDRERSVRSRKNYLLELASIALFLVSNHFHEALEPWCFNKNCLILSSRSSLPFLFFFSFANSRSNWLVFTFICLIFSSIFGTTAINNI